VCVQQMAAGSLGLHGLDLEAYCLVYTTTDIKKFVTSVMSNG